MSTPTHIAFSFILSEYARKWGIPIQTRDIFLIIGAGNIVDIDYFVSLYKGRRGDRHHGMITHTPIGIFLIWGISWFILHNKYSSAILFLALLSLFLHLVLDDLSHWLYKLKLQKWGYYPQINWLYPKIKFHNLYIDSGAKKFIREYLSQAKLTIYLEIIFIIWAIYLLLI